MRMALTITMTLEIRNNDRHSIPATPDGADVEGLASAEAATETQVTPGNEPQLNPIPSEK